MSITRILRAASLVGLTLALPFASMAAQGPVSGQVSIIERPGDKTEDLGNTVIYLDPTDGAKQKPAAVSKSIPLQARNFTTHVMVIPAGSKIAFPNQDPWSHNVFTKAPQGPFDTDLYRAGKSKDNVFKEAGVYPLYCNIHPRMTAFVIAVKTPYFTQAGTDGRFSIGNVPAGKYALHVWHERGGEKIDTIVVAAAGVGLPKVQLDARNYKYIQHKDKNGKDYVYNGDIY